MPGFRRRARLGVVYKHRVQPSKKMGAKPVEKEVPAPTVHGQYRDRSGLRVRVELKQMACRRVQTQARSRRWGWIRSGKAVSGYRLGSGSGEGRETGGMVSHGCRVAWGTKSEGCDDGVS